jgi:hypothetical protein
VIVRISNAAAPAQPGPCALVSRWASLSADTYPAEVQQSLTAAGILLFEQLFVASPQMKRLFPFVDAEGNPSREVQSLGGSLLVCGRPCMSHAA